MTNEQCLIFFSKAQSGSDRHSLSLNSSDAAVNFKPLSVQNLNVPPLSVYRQD